MAMSWFILEAHLIIRLLFQPSFAYVYTSIRLW
jgi:hypothetical protein